MRVLKVSVVAAAVAALASCATTSAPPPIEAKATLKPTAGNGTFGTVTFTQRGDRVLVAAQVSNLTPGPHGFHIHEKGDCSSADGMSAGGHFNPTSKPHGDPRGGDHHVGDMPMIVADGTGNAILSTELTGMTIGGGPNDIVGRAVIVHKDPDDFKTQPTGNSGARVACGVIARS